MLAKVLKFISPFLSSHLDKDSESIHNALRGMSYGQAAIAFSVFMKDIEHQSSFMAVFTFIFPIFLALGVVFGMMAQQKSRNGELLAVTSLLFLAATILHAIALFIFFFRINYAAAIAFLFSIIGIANLAGFGAKLYGHISKKDSAEK